MVENNTFQHTHEAMQNLENCLRRTIEKPDLGSLKYMAKTAEEIEWENWLQMTGITYGNKQYSLLKVHNQILASADENIKVMLEINCMKADNATAQLCMALKVWQGSEIILEQRLKEFQFTALPILQS